VHAIYIFNSFDGGGFGMCHSKTGGGEPPDPNTRKRLSLKDGKRLPAKDLIFMVYLLY